MSEPDGAGAAGQVHFSAWHFGAYYVWLGLLLAMLVLTLAVRTWGVVIFFAAYLVLFAVIAPLRQFASGGVPRSMTGSVLTLHRPINTVREVDLGKAAVGGLLGGRVMGGRSRWLVLGHPDGHRLSRATLGRMGPDDEVSALFEHSDRFIVVPLAGGFLAEVLGPVGSVLAERGSVRGGVLRHQCQLAQEGRE